MSRQFTFQFLVVVGDSDILKVFTEQITTAPQFAEQIVDIPDPAEGLQGFRPGQGSTASSSSSHSPAGVLGDADEPFEGFFRTFSPPPKSAKVGRQVSARAHGHSSPSELSAHQMLAVDEEPTLEDFFVDQAGGVWMHVNAGLWKLLGTDTCRAGSG